MDAAAAYASGGTYTVPVDGAVSWCRTVLAATGDANGAATPNVDRITVRLVLIVNLSTFLVLAPDFGS